MDRSNKAPNADGVFDYAPYLYVNGGRFKHNSNDVGNCNRNYGSTSVVLRVTVSPLCD